MSETTPAPADEQPTEDTPEEQAEPGGEPAETIDSPAGDEQPGEGPGLPAEQPADESPADSQPAEGGEPAAEEAPPAEDVPPPGEPLPQPEAVLVVDVRTETYKRKPFAFVVEYERPNGTRGTAKYLNLNTNAVKKGAQVVLPEGALP